MVLASGIATPAYIAAGEVSVYWTAPGAGQVTGQGRVLQQKEKDRAKKDDENEKGPGYSVSMGGIGFRPSGAIGGWAPGQLARRLPPEPNPLKFYPCSRDDPFSCDRGTPLQ